jgi:hypothetical protein
MTQAQILRHDALPFYLALGGLVAAALLVDAALHLLDMVWIGRWLGPVGTLIILGSFGYSLVKRKRMKGKPAQMLMRHERMAWIGTLLVLVHAGVHFNAVLAWLAVIAMLVNVSSGLTGKYLLQRARQRLTAAREGMRQSGLVEGDVESRTQWDRLTYDALKQWRVVHVPITLAFGVLALAHIIAIALFWGWH